MDCYCTIFFPQLISNKRHTKYSVVRGKQILLQLCLSDKLYSIENRQY